MVHLVEYTYLRPGDVIADDNNEPATVTAVSTVQWPDGPRIMVTLEDNGPIFGYPDDTLDLLTGPDYHEDRFLRYSTAPDRSTP